MSQIPAIGPDGALFPIDKMDAHRAGQLHVAVSIFLFDGPRLLIQRRAAGKYHCPGLWANTACSHPHWGEEVHDAARRRLHEELGLSAPLTPIGVTEYRADVGGGLVEHERVHMFRGDASPDERAAPDPAEVSELRWVTAEALGAELAERAEDFAPWFRIYCARWPDFSFGAEAG